MMLPARAKQGQFTRRLGAQPNGFLWLGVLGISLLAGFIRFYRLADLPPGLHYDEAFNGLDAYALLSRPVSQWPVFFTGNFGREPLFIYLLALAQSLFGASAVTLRAVPAAIGTLLTPALAWLGWEAAASLACERRRLALWSGVAALGLLWSQIFSRYVLRVELFALLETLFLAALWRGWRTQRMLWFGFAGLMAGLAFYTYLPVRLLPAVFVPAGLLLVWRHRSSLAPGRLRGVLVAGVLAAAVAAPLVHYFISNPAAFWQRIEQVSTFSDPEAVLRNGASVLGMFVGPGDATPRSNLPGRPLLDWVAAPFFFWGLLQLARRITRPGPLLILSWFGVMLAPTVLSEYAPSFQRAIGALPAICLILAVGLDHCATWLARRLPRQRAWVEAGGWAVLAASIAIAWRAFMAWSASPELFYARDVGFVALARALTLNHSGETVYLSPRGDDHPTVRYMLIEARETPDLYGFDGRSCLRVADDGPASYVFLVQEDARGPNLLPIYLPGGVSRPLVLDPAGDPWAIAVAQPARAAAQFPEMRALPVDLADGVQLLGYWLSEDPVRPESRLYVRLFWRSAARPSLDYTVFVHLLKAAPGGAEVLAGADAQPGRGACRTTDWRPGEVIVDELELVLPADLGGAPVYLEVGMYDLASGVRMAVPGVPENRILIGPIAAAP